mmetsp:Transcript_53375/g.62331  ORF Transcript_53375/g.62331 Transcript_53375/m.62331 type:complete len:202 (+) Transcript_53375:515-1120(+)
MAWVVVPCLVLQMGETRGETVSSRLDVVVDVDVEVSREGGGGGMVTHAGASRSRTRVFRAVVRLGFGLVVEGTPLVVDLRLFVVFVVFGASSARADDFRRLALAVVEAGLFNVVESPADFRRFTPTVLRRALVVADGLVVMFGEVVPDLLRVDVEVSAMWTGVGFVEAEDMGVGAVAVRGERRRRWVVDDINSREISDRSF